MGSTVSGIELSIIEGWREYTGYAAVRNKQLFVFWDRWGTLLVCGLGGFFFLVSIICVRRLELLAVWSYGESIPEIDKVLFLELCRSMLEIMEMLSVSKEKGISIYSIKGGWELNGSIQSKVMAMAFSIAAEIERDLISKRTREALRARKASGVKLGRPKGPGKSKLNEYSEEIVALRKMGQQNLCCQ